MMNHRQIFQSVLAQTSPDPLMLEIVSAKGCYLYGADGRKYLDLIGGICVCNLGHSHPEVTTAIQQQATKYLHIMVYGELIQSPQLKYAQLLVQHLDHTLNNVFFTNSGAEAVEGAMKLAKKFTRRTEIIACENSYHGSTQGALSLLGDEHWRKAYRPLLPDIRHIRFNSFDDIALITEKTAAVFLEPIQAEAGVVNPEDNWLHAIRKRCTEVGALLIFDEIQTGFGRTGHLFAHQGLGVVPDILLLAKALGGGMPLGAFITRKDIMSSLSHNPILGHITTFGGHPISCAAGYAAMKTLLTENIIDDIYEKRELFLKHLDHAKIQNITSAGLMIALHLKSFEQVQQVINVCLESANPVFMDWFLFAPSSIRIAPPLVITPDEIIEACTTINNALSRVCTN